MTTTNAENLEVDLKAIKIEEPIQEESRPKLGRPPKNPETSVTKTTGPPPSQPFTGFHPSEIPQRPNLLQAFVPSSD